MRKFVAILMAMTMILGLVACGNKDTEPAGTTPAVEDTQTEQDAEVPEETEPAKPEDAEAPEKAEATEETESAEDGAVFSDDEIAKAEELWGEPVSEFVFGVDENTPVFHVLLPEGVPITDLSDMMNPVDVEYSDVKNGILTPSYSLSNGYFAVGLYEDISIEGLSEGEDRTVDNNGLTFTGFLMTDNSTNDIGYNVYYVTVFKDTHCFTFLCAEHSDSPYYPNFDKIMEMVSNSVK